MNERESAREGKSKADALLKYSFVIWSKQMGETKKSHTHAQCAISEPAPNKLNEK